MSKLLIIYKQYFVISKIGCFLNTHIFKLINKDLVTMQTHLKFPRLLRGIKNSSNFSFRAIQRMRNNCNYNILIYFNFHNHVETTLKLSMLNFKSFPLRQTKKVYRVPFLQIFQYKIFHLCIFLLVFLLQ